ncbi:MAG: uL22 family ribosomal protein [Candidatus Aenigmatarchaeota archaeon]
MTYTFEPKQKYAKAYGSNLRISTKKAVVLSRVMRGKKLSSARRLLDGLLNEARTLDGKYYTKTAKNVLMLLKSCEKNAESMNMNIGNLFVHVSASQGSNLRRRRRKSAFGSSMKTTNLEIFLVERGTSPDVTSKKDRKETGSVKVDKTKKPIDTQKHDSRAEKVKKHIAEETRKV